MKLCKDCKHYLPTAYSDLAMCGNTVSPVHGGPEEFCTHERERKRKGCGPDAVHFEPARRHGQHSGKVTTLPDEPGVLLRMWRWLVGSA